MWCSGYSVLKGEGTAMEEEGAAMEGEGAAMGKGNGQTYVAHNS